MIQGQDGETGDLNIYQPPFRDFVSPKTRKRIFWGVVIVHVSIIVLPMLWFSLLSLLTPKPMKVMKISLVNIPSDFPIPSKNPSKTNATPSDTVPPDPGPLSPLPSEPAPEPEPDPTPAPVPPSPKPTPPKPTPTPKPKEKTPAPKEKTPTPKEKTPAPKEDAKKPDKKKTTAEDILKNSQVVKGAPPSKSTKKARGGGGPPNPDAIIRNIKEGLAQPAGGGGGPIGEVGDADKTDEYYASVSRYLYNNWQRPGKALLGNSKPSVDVKVSVAANGQILSATIVGRSGNALMDASVERLFAMIKALPVPPKAMEFTIKMMIADE